MVLQGGDDGRTTADGEDLDWEAGRRPGSEDGDAASGKPKAQPRLFKEVRELVRALWVRFWGQQLGGKFAMRQIKASGNAMRNTAQPNLIPEPGDNYWAAGADFVLRSGFQLQQKLNAALPLHLQRKISFTLFCHTVRA